MITHTHPDHVGNLCRADGSSAFPKAAVYVPEDDWTFFIRNEPDLSRLPMPEDFRRAFIANIKRSVTPIAKSAVLFRPGSELLPGVTTIAASGHTPGMSAILIHSGRQQLLITSDAAYSPLLNIEIPGDRVPISIQNLLRKHVSDCSTAPRRIVSRFWDFIFHSPASVTSKSPTEPIAG